MSLVINEGELISIIVPVYNVKPYLSHCLETIVSQSYHNLEIILVVLAQKNLRILNILNTNYLTLLNHTYQHQIVFMFAVF